MESGKNKILLIKLVIAIAGCLVIIFIHQISYEWYINNFTPRSRGVSLGFVMFYMKYIVLPAIFLSVFIKMKYSLMIVVLISVYMFISWYNTNPLRVMLMFTSFLLGYAVVIFSRTFIIKQH